ncbi:unnamed protein product [Adineta steineri]|nr:unnamed protein product [Adineta steineri]CAF1148299.1 unnamed protein product [Adineta steineri]CAF3629455.1 unnamed protein product [Adineta steineri]CAF3871507.1 unnamed protein product [Adineta steineri]
MADNNTTRNSFCKSRSPTNSYLLQQQTSLSPSNSPNNKGNNSLSRGRQLWNIAIENVLEHEKTPPISLSLVSSAVDNEPIGWHNLTKR